MYPFQNTCAKDSFRLSWFHPRISIAKILWCRPGLWNYLWNQRWVLWWYNWSLRWATGSLLLVWVLWKSLLNLNVLNGMRLSHRFGRDMPQRIRKCYQLLENNRMENRRSPMERRTRLSFRLGFESQLWLWCHLSRLVKCRWNGSILGHSYLPA